MQNHQSLDEQDNDMPGGEGYFAKNAPPASINEYKKSCRAFMSLHQAGQRRVVLVTSGGTTVPLENQTVRFIDNFSAGTRGATSAEYFLEHGYAVIFLHRQFSLLPYSRHYSHSTNCFLDFMTTMKDGQVVIQDGYQQKMAKVLQKYHAARENNRLLLLPFTTINDYLWSLKEISLILRPLGPRSLFYLAAAVSDFFLPKDRLSEHKIQSTRLGDRSPEHFPMLSNGLSGTGQSNKLSISLDPVPKLLQTLVDGWAPEGMIVSFKLETDPDLLITKARQALDRYSHHAVIGNLLSTRKFEVVLITQREENWIRVPKHQRTSSVTNMSPLIQMNSGPGPESVTIEIESLIVPEIIKMHDSFIQISMQENEEDEQNMLANALAWADSTAD